MNIKSFFILILILLAKLFFSFGNNSFIMAFFSNLFLINVFLYYIDKKINQYAFLLIILNIFEDVLFNNPMGITSMSMLFGIMYLEYQSSSIYYRKRKIDLFFAGMIYYLMHFIISIYFTNNAFYLIRLFEILLYLILVFFVKIKKY